MNTHYTFRAIGHKKDFTYSFWDCAFDHALQMAKMEFTKLFGRTKFRVVKGCEGEF